MEEEKTATPTKVTAMTNRIALRGIYCDKKTIDHLYSALFSIVSKDLLKIEFYKNEEKNKSVVIVTLDTIEAAEKIYNQTDGVDFFGLEIKTEVVPHECILNIKPNLSVDKLKEVCEAIESKTKRKDHGPNRFEKKKDERMMKKKEKKELKKKKEDKTKHLKLDCDRFNEVLNDSDFDIDTKENAYVDDKITDDIIKRKKEKKIKRKKLKTNAA